MRFVVLILMLLASLTMALAERKVHEGELEVAFGYVRGLDGKKHSIKGVKLPYVAVPIAPEAVTRLKVARGKVQSADPPKPTTLRDIADSMVDPRWMASLSPAGMTMSRTIYEATAGGYATITGDGFIDPSSLDNHELSTGANQTWEHLTFGVHMTESKVFLIRWIVYDNYTAGLGHDVNAFSGVIADFGVLFALDPPFYTQPYASGPWDVTIDVRPQPLVGFPGVTCPDNTIYMAQQFRDRQPNGEGPFEPGMENLWNFQSPPTIGSSDNNFFYDWDPLNGKYAEDELEVLEAPNYANLMRRITVFGTQESCNPFQFSYYGVLVSGELVDLWDSDDAYVRLKPRWDGARTDPTAVVTVDGITSSTSVNGIQFFVEAAGSSGGGSQRIQLWNWLTSAWDTVDTRPISNTDVSAGGLITGNFTRYVNASRRMRARIAFFTPTNVDRQFQVRVDQMLWLVTHP